MVLASFQQFFLRRIRQRVQDNLFTGWEDLEFFGNKQVICVLGEIPTEAHFMATSKLPTGSQGLCDHSLSHDFPALMLENQHSDSVPSRLRLWQLRVVTLWQQPANGGWGEASMELKGYHASLRSKMRRSPWRIERETTLSSGATRSRHSSLVAAEVTRI